MPTLTRAAVLFLPVAVAALSLAVAAPQSENLRSTAEREGLDPAAVVILPVEVLSTNPDFDSLAELVYGELRRRVAAVDGVNLIDESLVRPFTTSDLGPHEIGRQLGAAYVLKGSVAEDSPGYQVRYAAFFVPNENGASSGGGYSQRPWQPGALLENGADSILDSAAELIAEYLHPDRHRQALQSARAEARARFLNPDLQDRARLDALRKLQPATMGTYPRSYSDGGASLAGEIALAAAELGSRSDDSDVRRAVWRAMTGVADTVLVDPLLHALRTDPDTEVRAAAAEALAHHLHEPGVRAALDDAVERNPDDAAGRAAYLAGASREQRTATFREIAMNASLTERERQQGLFKVWQRILEGEFQPDVAFARSMIEFAASTENDFIHRLTWSVMGESSLPVAADALTDALTAEPNENTREVIVGALSNLIDKPGIHDILVEVAADDPSPLVRAKANRVLEDNAGSN